MMTGCMIITHRNWPNTSAPYSIIFVRYLKRTRSLPPMRIVHLRSSHSDRDMILVVVWGKVGLFQIMFLRNILMMRHYGAFVNSTDPSRIADHTYDTRICTYVVILYRVLIFFN